MFRFIAGTLAALSMLFPVREPLAGEKQQEQLRITYQTTVNGEVRTRGGRTIVVAGPEAAKSFSENPGVELIPQTPQEAAYINFSTNTTYQVADLFDSRRIYTETEFTEYPEIEETGETEEILGYTCKKVKASLRSNSIEIWYTNELQAKGTPLMSHGIVDGLVLKVVRNGNYGLLATDIRELKKKEVEPVIPEYLGEKVDAACYRHLVTGSFITTVEVFTDEQISWGNPIENPEGVQAGKTYRYAGGTIIAKRVKLPVMTPDYLVFAELEQYSNGDAYDRTGTVFIIPEDKEQSFFDALEEGVESVPAFSAANGKNYHAAVATPDFSPAVELVRFFTPFGTGHFNDQVEVYGQQWEDIAYYKQDISDLLPLLQEEVWIGVFIGNYDKGGHKISLDIKYYPGSREVREKSEEEKTWIYPLFNTLNIMEMAGQEYGTLFENDSLSIEFEVPEGVTELALRYISTGHGGWGGGDEFNQKVNEIMVDGKKVFSYIPWNSNCGAYRKYNPASGNFWNGVTSSDYSRSGWCPGEATNPVYVPLPGLKPGKHVLKVAIPLGEREGGSFSHWNVSGVLTGKRY
ncbi:MAG: PNGase F N-terminal domain-containing protein [Mariniphaga sp.]